MSTEVVAINLVELLLVYLVISNDLVDSVKLAQTDDLELREFMERSFDVSVDNEGLLRFRGSLCVPKYDALRHNILEEAHCSKFSMIHLKVTKMHHDLKQVY